MYATVLLLSLQFKALVGFLAKDSSSRAYRVDAPHIAIALLHHQVDLPYPRSLQAPKLFLNLTTVEGSNIHGRLLPGGKLGLAKTPHNTGSIYYGRRLLRGNDRVGSPWCWGSRVYLNYSCQVLKPWSFLVVKGN
jgi:hypothetical protein